MLKIGWVFKVYNFRDGSEWVYLKNSQKYKIIYFCGKKYIKTNNHTYFLDEANKIVEIKEGGAF